VKRADQLHRRQSRHQRIAAGLAQQQPIIATLSDFHARRAVANGLDSHSGYNALRLVAALSGAQHQP
jgi:hypothetical protein